MEGNERLSRLFSGNLPAMSLPFCCRIAVKKMYCEIYKKAIVEVPGNVIC